MLSNRQQSGGRLNSGLSFWLPLNDAGAGAVSLVPNSSAGSATSTFTRATSATCWGPTGLLLTVVSGTPRSTYTELTGATYLGYLAEEARTNNALWCRDLSHAGTWVGLNTTAVLDQVGIDGAANSASRLTATLGNGLSQQGITIAAVNRPFSAYIKRLSGTGNIDFAQDGASFTTQTVPNDGLWHRCTLVASQLNPTLTIRLVTNGDSIAVDYAMLEDNGGGAATFPLSPILTTTVAVTRNADSLNYPMAGNIVGTQGTAACEVTSQAGGTTYTLYAGGTSAPLYVNVGAQVRFLDGTNNNTGAAITPSLTTPNKVASRWTGALGTTYVAGVPATSTAFDGDLNLGVNLLIGSTAGNNIQNGTIKNIRIWSVPLADAQIASL